MNALILGGGIVLVAVALKLAAGLVLLRRRTPSARAKGVPMPDGGAADPLIQEANRRLAQTRVGLGVANLPMIFVIGDKGTGKTSAILNSGLDAELLAGQVYQDNAVEPTRVANIFLARGTVLVEAGGAVTANLQSWKALVEKLLPSRLKSIGSSGQAPRGVLLCFDLETFVRSGATEALAHATRGWRARLGEIAEILGISYPVYVLFTGADRLPFFAEFVRHLSLGEAGQVVGATVPIRTVSAVSSEAEKQRLTRAFDRLFHSFCDHRMLLLPREDDATKVPQAYEFPHEFGKLRSSLVQFLVDVCGPRELPSGPFLRGFYFSGVRLVAPTAAPEWLFLGQLFNDVVLADANGRAASGLRAGTSLTKRIVLSSAAGLMLLYSALLIWSYFGNRELEREPLTAAQGIAATEGSGGAIPGIDSLQKLETVRQSLAKLTAYGRDGAPLRLRWGLYKGSEILPDVRKIYYAKFRQLLFGPTQAQMLASMQRSPAVPVPNDDDGPPYDTLKSYLLTTSEWKRSSDARLQAFLATNLDGRWVGSKEGEIGRQRLDLARKQFEFYAADLPNGNPYSPVADEDAVTRVRVYLSRFSGLERVNRDGAFTKNGARVVDGAIRNQNFAGEEWVPGPYRGQMPDEAGIQHEKSHLKWAPK
jgi:type VI secretion system protein ImpL